MNNEPKEQPAPVPTPGPWEYRTYQECVLTSTQIKFGSASVRDHLKGVRVLCSIDVHDDQHNLHEASPDARLIVAACNQMQASAEKLGVNPIELAAVDVAGLVEASSEFRDAVLNERDHLEGMGFNNDQINALLSLFDETIGEALATLPGKAAR